MQTLHGPVDKFSLFQLKLLSRHFSKFEDLINFSFLYSLRVVTRTFSSVLEFERLRRSHECFVIATEFFQRFSVHGAVRNQTKLLMVWFNNFWPDNSLCSFRGFFLLQNPRRKTTISLRSYRQFNLLEVFSIPGVLAMESRNFPTFPILDGLSFHTRIILNWEDVPYRI